ncbi:endonuclease/exonuclease/phosphatase family protein [Mycolicibacterium sp. F2034L]|uniref:endonuclease/exonuclease/phosphatase family protein n=1 Tax=Mycolicibacterium sp. F2034L TaxID=2926422 RepID=UPI001FF4E373|nr:endonuclease/exonuclease/phosphatase family protein [Mycolicibacterium sp. F2034L]MCK0173782.1 endonuclease/exonuclease/phosphatase family protein [Mycolicibacterium sp. F2034L]
MVGVGLAICVIALVARTFPLPNIAALPLAIGAAYVPAAAFLGLMAATSYRRPLLSAAAALVLLAGVTVQGPWYYGGEAGSDGQHTALRVLSSNLRKGQADPATIVRLAQSNADVITFSELTPEMVQRLQGAGLDDTFPHSLLEPEPGAGGIGLWSRHPVTSLTFRSVPNTSMVAAQIQTPDVRFSPIITSVHVMSPLAADTNTFEQWRSGIAATKARLDDFADLAGPGAVIVGGDFNSTPDMRQFRDLLTNGYRDAVEQTGSGFSPTFPVHDWIPPLITIDHILTHNAAASSIKTVTIPGSDHRALLATIKVPLDPTAS